MRKAPCFCGVLICSAALLAQAPIAGSGPNGSVNILNSDLAVLEAGETRKDLPCTVGAAKPLLGFDMKFHAGYDISVPMSDLAGSDNDLNILFRVIPDTHKDSPVYFAQHVRVPVIDEDAKGDAYIQGAFDIGEGKYHVDWLMRDRSDRVCSDSWD